MIFLFEDLDTSLIRLALYKKSGLVPRLAYGRLKEMTVQEILELCVISPQLSQQVYRLAVQGLSVYNPSTCNELEIIQNMDNKKVFDNFTPNEVWLLIYSLVKNDFKLAYRLFRDASLNKQFKENFTEQALRRDDFYSSHNNIFLLTDCWQIKTFTINEAQLLKDACAMKKSNFSFWINSAILVSKELSLRYKLLKEVHTLKPSALKVGLAYTWRFIFGESYFKETILLYKACKLVIDIVKSKPVLTLDLSIGRKQSIPISSSPKIETEQRAHSYDLLKFVPDLQRTGNESPTSSSEIETSSNESSPRVKR